MIEFKIETFIKLMTFFHKFTMAKDVANLVMGMIDEKPIDIYSRSCCYKVCIKTGGQLHDKLFKDPQEASDFMIFHAGITAMDVLGFEPFGINFNDSKSVVLEKIIATLSRPCPPKFNLAWESEHGKVTGIKMYCDGLVFYKIVEARVLSTSSELMYNSIINKDRSTVNNLITDRLNESKIE